MTSYQPEVSPAPAWTHISKISKSILASRVLKLSMKDKIIILSSIFFQPYFFQAMNMIVGCHFACLHFWLSLFYMLIETENYLDASLNTLVI